jgi:hypothetical protein
MSDERIDIEINDRIAASIPTKLEAIAAGATKGQAAVLKLKAELAAVNDTSVTKLKAAMEGSTTSINKQLAAQSALSKETDAAAASDLKQVSSKAKLVAEIDAETAARTRLALAVDRGLANQAAAMAPSASFAAGKNPFQGEANLAGNAASVGASVRAMNAEVAVAEAATVGSFGRIKNAAMGAFDFMRDAFYAQAANFKGMFGGTGVAKMEAEAAAVTKVGHAAGGSSLKIRELLVMGREASVGNWTRMAGSASILATAFGVLNAAIPLAIIGFAGLAAAKVSLNTEAEQNSLTKYAQSLGLTEKEMRKLKDTTVDANGKMHEHNELQIQFGDVFGGVVRTIKQGIGAIGEYYGITTEKAKEFTTNAIGFLKDFFSYMVGGVYATGKFIFETVSNLFTLAYDVGRVTGNAIYVLYATLANGVIAIWNGVANIANTVSNALHQGDVIGKIGYMNGSIGNLANGLRGMKGQDFFGDVRKGADATNKVLAKTAQNIRDVAKERVKAEVDAIKANRNPHKAHTKKDSDPKTREDYLNDTNKKLDDELSRMHLLKDAREEQSRLDQIEEEFLKRRQPLTAKEIEGFKAKIHAIQEFKYQQAEMDRIYEAATGPLRTYNASIAASNDLLKRGAISQFDFSKEVVRATRAYKEATDPLFAMKEAMDQAERSMGLYGHAAEQASYYEQIRQAYLAKNIELSPTYVAGLNAEVDALMRRNAANQQQSPIDKAVGEIVNPMIQDNEMLANKQKYYDELNRMGSQYNLSEKQRAQARYALDYKFLQMRLSGYEQFFGVLAQLSSSKNKKLAAIGKAAAVAQATIDGYLAVQKALATIPPPMNIPVAAATAVMTGVQVAGILSTNVGSFDRGTDFMVHGNPGVDRNNINMNVSRGERVIVQTPAQQREAARNGGGPTQVTVPVKVINVRDRDELATFMRSDEGEQIVLNILKDNPQHVAAAAGSGTPR